RQFGGGAGVQDERQPRRSAAGRLGGVEGRLKGRRVAHELIGQDELFAGRVDIVEIADRERGIGVGRGEGEDPRRGVDRILAGGGGRRHARKTAACIVAVG